MRTDYCRFLTLSVLPIECDQQWAQLYSLVDTSVCNPGILGISGFRPFSPILNPGIDSVSIPGLRDYKNSSKNVLF